MAELERRRPGIDDLDGCFYENYRCGRLTPLHRLLQPDHGPSIDRQSQELDRSKRLELVRDIQRRLEADVARPMLGWRSEYFTRWPP